jgi:hypothetical protein
LSLLGLRQAQPDNIQVTCQTELVEVCYGLLTTKKIVVIKSNPNFHVTYQAELVEAVFQVLLQLS